MEFAYIAIQIVEHVLVLPKPVLHALMDKLLTLTMSVDLIAEVLIKFLLTVCVNNVNCLALNVKLLLIIAQNVKVIIFYTIQRVFSIVL